MPYMPVAGKALDEPQKRENDRDRTTYSEKKPMEKPAKVQIKGLV